MNDRARRLLGVTESEWPRFTYASALSFVIFTGMAVGRVAKDAYFLDSGYASQVAKMYVFIACLLIPAAIIYGTIVDRVDGGGLLRRMLVLGAGGAAALWLGILAAGPRSGYLPHVAFCASEAYVLLLTIHFWAALNGVFEVQEGKRLLPLIGGAGLLGTFAGGLLTHPITHFFPASTLFAVWAALLLVCMPLSRRLFSDLCHGARRGGPNLEPTGSPAESGSVRALMGSLWQQPLIRTMAFMAVPLWMIIYVIEYSYLNTMSRCFRETPEDLASFLGTIVSVAAFIGFAVQFTVTPWLLRRFGVGATALVFPFSLICGTVALLIFSLFPEAAGTTSLDLTGIAALVVFARFCDVAVFYSVYDSTDQMLYSAVPDDCRGRERVLMAGVVAPTSMAAAGALLLLFRQLQEPVYNIAFVGVVLAFLLAIVALNVAPEYLAALVETIDLAKMEHQRELMDEFSKLEDSDARYVLLHGMTGSDTGQALFAARALFERRDEYLIEDIEEVLPRLSRQVLKEVRGLLTAQDRERHAGFVAELETRLRDAS